MSTPLPFTLTAKDQFGNVDTRYASVVTISGNDTTATYPAPSALTAGVGMFTVQYATTGVKIVTATGEPGGLMGSATQTVGGTDVSYILDFFVDTNGTALTAHTPNVGPGWTTSGTSNVIESNSAAANVASGNATRNAQDAGEADYILACDFTFRAGTFSEVPVRLVDSNNYVGIQAVANGTGDGWEVYKRVAGTVTDFYLAGPELTDGQTYHVVARVVGADMKVYIDYSLLVDATPLPNTTATLVGLTSFVNSGSSGVPLWSNLRVAPLIADFTGTPLSGLEPLSVTFTDQSESTGTITARSWTFGDGGTSTSQNPTHSYTVAGTYDVSLTVTDSNGKTDTKTRTGYVVASSTSNFSINMDGSGQIHIGSGVIANTDPFTMACWFKTSSGATSSPLWSRGNDAVGGWGVGCAVQSPLGQANTQVITTSSGSTFTSSGLTPIVSANAWHHLAFVWEPGGTPDAVRVYLDGVLESGGATSANTLRFGSGDSGVGYSLADGSAVGFGQIYQPAIWNTVISDANIAALAAGAAPTTLPTDLLLFWPMTEGSGTTVGDTSGNGNNGTILDLTHAVWDSDIP